jgi:hypothetical protein
MGVLYGFTTGEIWTIDTYRIDALRGDDKHPGISLEEEDFTQALKDYSECLSALGIQPPYRWIAGMSGIKGVGLWVPVRPGYSRWKPGPIGCCMVEEVIAEGLHSPDEPAGKSLLPFFRAVYESCGLDRPEWLDQHGE